MVAVGLPRRRLRKYAASCKTAHRLTIWAWQEGLTIVLNVDGRSNTRPQSTPNLTSLPLTQRIRSRIQRSQLTCVSTFVFAWVSRYMGVKMYGERTILLIRRQISRAFRPNECRLTKEGEKECEEGQVRLNTARAATIRLYIPFVSTYHFGYSCHPRKVLVSGRGPGGCARVK